MKTRKTIGVVGLGNMVYPIAENLIKAGYDVVGYEIDQSQRKPRDHLVYVDSLGDLIGQTAMLDKILGQVVTGLFNTDFRNSLMLKDISLYPEGCNEVGITAEVSRTVVQL
jgi:3-hydroxyisobutyrate dehydrogenase-like beta-hydroxyacid dehydrogenase